MKIKKELILKFLLVILLLIPSLLPLFKRDFFRMHDYTHVARLHQLDKALKEGHFPVRWSKDLGWGYGMPMFNFYAPLPYYIAEIFHLLGFSFLDSIKIVFGLTFLFAFWGMYLFAKKFWDKKGAFLAAIAFVYSPYRAVDFYVRGALGELVAISILPWSFWIIWELAEKKKVETALKAALILATLFLSHTVLTLLSFFILMLVCLFFIFLNKPKIKSFLLGGISFCLALGLSSFFLLPAFFEKKFIHTNKLIEGFSHYSHHFLYFRQFIYGNWGYGGSVDSIPDLMSFHLGKVHLSLVIFTLFFILWEFLFTKKISLRFLTSVFFAIFICFLAWLSTYHAKFVWDKIPLMAFIQFPWRLNSLIIVFLGFLTGGGVFYLEKKLGAKIALIFLIIAIFTLLKVNVRYFKPEKYINPNQYYYTDEESIKKSMSNIIPDYVPIWVQKEPVVIAQKDYEIISGSPEVEVLESKTQKFILKVNSQQQAEIQLNKFYFPGWKVFIDKKESPFSYKDNNGIIKISVPAQIHIVKLVLKPTPIRFISDIISLVSLLLIGGFFVKKRFF